MQQLQDNGGKNARFRNFVISKLGIKPKLKLIDTADRIPVGSFVKAVVELKPQDRITLFTALIKELYSVHTKAREDDIKYIDIVRQIIHEEGDDFQSAMERLRSLLTAVRTNVAGGRSATIPIDKLIKSFTGICTRYDYQNYHDKLALCASWVKSITGGNPVGL